MSFVTCPCGFRADGFARETLAAYRAHDCQYHDAEAVAHDEGDHDGGPNWATVACWMAFWLFLSFICTDGWGRFS